MKKITLIVFLTTFFLYSYSQQYVEAQNIDKFIGTWEYASGKEKFNLVISKDTKFVKNLNVYIKLLTGVYTYNNGSILIENFKTPEQNPLDNGTIFDKEKSLFKVQFLFWDNVKNKLGDLRFDLSETDPNEATWTLTNMEGVRLIHPGVPPFDQTFSVPVKMKMKRLTKPIGVMKKK